MSWKSEKQIRNELIEENIRLKKENKKLKKELYEATMNSFQNLDR